jgi:hypothetical protein
MTTSLPVAFATKNQQGLEMQDPSLGPMSLMVPEKFSNKKSSMWVALSGSGFAGMTGRVPLYKKGDSMNDLESMLRLYLLVKVAIEIPARERN